MNWRKLRIALAKLRAFEIALQGIWDIRFQIAYRTA